MKQALTLTIIILLLTFSTLFGQKTFEPQILILSPNDVTYDQIFEKEIAGYNELIKQDANSKESEKEVKSKEFEKQPGNIRRMTQSEVSFGKTLDFVKQISFMSEQFLAYRFFEKFPDLLIQLSTATSKGSLPQLKQISEKENFQYVLNFPGVEFYKQNEISYSKIAVQLYDHTTNSLLIDTSYTGDWYNPGFEFACQDSTLNCTISNSLSQALNDIIYIVASNSPKLIKERQLQKERLSVIVNDYYKKSFDKDFIITIIPKKDSNINLNIIYQGLINNDKTKFVAFFLEKVTPRNFKQLNDNQNDKNVNIINDKSIKDSGCLDNIPRTYAYIVKAVQYKGKWYYEKSNVTYFEVHDNEEGHLQFLNNLQEWNFFKDGSTKLNPGFWETNLFSKIKNLRKDPEWNKYGKTIWKTEEEENKKYIGMYEIVADQLKNNTSKQPKRITVN